MERKEKDRRGKGGSKGKGIEWEVEFAALALRGGVDAPVLLQHFTLLSELSFVDIVGLTIIVVVVVVVVRIFTAWSK